MWAIGDGVRRGQDTVRTKRIQYSRIVTHSNGNCIVSGNLFLKPTVKGSFHSDDDSKNERSVRFRHRRHRRLKRECHRV
jgi:hypothetical protein